jgi:hypothetical protein
MNSTPGKDDGIWSQIINGLVQIIIVIIKVAAGGSR